MYRYLLQPSEEHDDQRRRATDRIWSKASYRLREVVESPGNRVMYYLADGPERAFVSEELMLIPEDTELPPDYVQEWYWVRNRRTRTRGWRKPAPRFAP